MQEQTRIRVRDTDDASDVYAFLSDKPVAWSRLVAARAALRVLPALLRPFHARAPQLWMLGFRACFIPWASGKFPAHDLDQALYSASRSAYTGTRSLYHWEDVDDRNASAASAALASAEFAAGPSMGPIDQSAPRWDSRSNGNIKSAVARLAADAVARAAKSIFDPEGSNKYWLAIEADLNWLLDRSTAVLPTSFSAQSLWNDRPQWRLALEGWQEFVSNKVAIDDGYDPWIGWYNGVLTGTDPFGPDLTLRIAQQTDEWWNRKVAEVNADIAAWLAEKENTVNVPAPEPGLASTIDADGRIGFARSGEAMAGELAVVAGLFRVLTGTVEDLAALLVGNNSVAIAPSIVPQYLACLRADVLSIDMLYALGVRLGNARGKLQKQIDSKDYPDLAPDVAEALDSVLELHGPVLLSTAEGRRLVDASSDYLRTAADNAALKRAAMDYGQAVAKSPDLFNKETRELLPALNEDVASGPHPERSTQVAMSASRNLLITVARVVLFETLKSGLAASVVGIGMIGVTAQTINFSWAFLTSYLPVVHELAAVSGPYLQWIEPLLRKAEKRLRE